MAIVKGEHYRQLCTLDLQALDWGLHFSIYFFLGDLQRTLYSIASRNVNFELQCETEIAS